MTREPASGTWDMEALRSHIQTQLTRIEALDVQRDDGLHKELDGRFELLQLQLDQRQVQMDQRLHSLQELLTAAAASLDRVLSQRIDDGERAIGAAMASAERAVLKAEAASEKRFECVSADTPILCADLVWRPAHDLVEGDELIALDEKSPGQSGRRFRRATVTANSLHRDELLLITTPAGAVRCNPQHPWLVRRGNPAKRALWHWMDAREIRPGDYVMKSVDTWEVDRSWEAGWLAGMYDGEGCLSFHANGSTSQLTMSQRESPTADRMIQALKERAVTGCLHRRERRGNWQPVYHYIISSHADVMKILGSVRPPRLLERSARVWEGKVIGGRDRAVPVTSVEPAGTGLIAALSTSSRTYIAGGFAMHNSINEFRAALGDQQRNLLPRIEYDTAHTALAERTTEMGERLAALELRLTSRLDTSSGRDLGSEGTRSELRLDRASLLQLFTLLVIAAGVIYSIWHH